MATSSGGDPGGTTGPRLPQYMDTRNEFGGLIFMQMREKNGGSLPKNPFIIGKSVEQRVGPIEGATSEAQGSRYTLRIRNPRQVEKLLGMNTLCDGTEIVIELHPVLNTCRCVISSFDLLQMEEAEIQKCLSSQGITHVKRITRNENGVRVNTPALILTLNKTHYPQHVKVGLLRTATRPYYPNPMMCYNCFKYGHTRLRCPGPTQDAAITALVNTKLNSAKKLPIANLSKGEHRPSNRKCPIYKRETEVVRAKVDHNLTFQEARKRVGNGSGSYAQTAAQPRIDNAKLEALIAANKKKDEEIAKLIEYANQKNKELERMEKMVQNMKEYIRSKPKTNTQPQLSNQELPPQPSSQPAGTVTQTSSSKRRSRIDTKDNTKTSSRSSEEISPDNNSPPSKRTTPTENDSDETMEQEEVQCISDEETNTQSRKLRSASHGAKPKRK